MVLVKVTATAINTEIGKIGKALDSVKEEPTQLKREMGTLSETSCNYWYSFMYPGNCHLYNHKGRFIKRFSGRNYSGNGYAARGISSGLNYFSCYWEHGECQKNQY